MQLCKQELKVKFRVLKVRRRHRIARRGFDVVVDSRVKRQNDRTVRSPAYEILG